MASTQTPDQADVVVIGGGILGCNAAYHLHKAGAGRIVLVEQAPELGMRTTVAGAGFVSFWGAEFSHWGPLELELERYALQFYRDLGAEHDIGFKAVGMMRIAVSPAGARLLGDQCRQARTLVAEDEVLMLDPDQIVDLVPGIQRARVCGALFWPLSICVDAPLAARAVGKELAAAGVRVYTNTTVTGIAVNRGRVSGVQTAVGPIVTDTVVAAAGAWLDHIGQMVGTAIPITPRLAWRFVTEPLPDAPVDLPMLFFSSYADLIDPQVYIRKDNGGLLIGANPRLAGRDLSRLRHVPVTASPDNPPVPTELVRYAEDVVRTFAPAWPVLGTIQVKERRSGLPAYTVDGRHVLGAVEAVPGLYVVGGDNEAGISHGPGLGTYVLPKETVTCAGAKSAWRASAKAWARGAA